MAASQNNIKRPKQFHGMTGSPEHDAWCGMKGRCFNSNTRKFKNHGGRGITIFPPWVDDFMAFYDYVGPRPSPQHSIDRYPDNNGNYEPGNVRWATIEEQNNNTRHNQIIEHDGLSLTVVQWERRLGLKRNTIYRRRKRGMSDVEALTAESVRRGVCRVCGDPMNAKGLCGKHYMQAKRAK